MTTNTFARSLPHLLLVELQNTPLLVDLHSCVDTELFSIRLLVFKRICVINKL